MSTVKKATLYVKGMHCPSCEILMNDKFKELKNVKEVKSDHINQKVEISYLGKFGSFEKELVNKKIKLFGYEIVDNLISRGNSETMTKRLFDVGGLAIIFFIIFYFAQELNIIPVFNSSSNLTLVTVFILGLVASTSTCMATSGALFLATVGKLNKSSNIVPAITFNFGRILSYGFFGFIAGLVGKTLISNFQISSLLTMLIAFFMVIIGLDMTKIISLQGIFTQRLTVGIFEKLEHKLIKNPKKSAFFLGAITYLLPCGFTQTVQLYALGLANPWASAMIMMVFALGTAPVLISIGFAASLTKSTYFPMLQKIMGTIVLLIGVYYLNNFLAIYNLSPLTKVKAVNQTYNIKMQNGVQIVDMNVNSYGYTPNSFVIKKGVPVRWQIKGDNVFGCQGYLVVPKFGIQKVLVKGENVIEFTPKEEGPLSFSCGMGMFRGSFNVVGS